MHTKLNQTQDSASGATEQPYINISAYKFVRLDRLSERREELLDLCVKLDLKGTILISSEGINVFVAGTRNSIDVLKEFFESRAEYRCLPFKESESDEQPFTRMLVRIKNEIIAFGVDGIEPAKRTSPKLQPEQLKRWLDEGKKLTLLDVRNDYEVNLGTFENAQSIGIDNFRSFPDAVKELPDELKQETVVMFCTGGIRCEKAGPFMENEGFSDVYQLDGGILKYFEDCGGQHYNGECFVFDKRVAVDPALNETDTEQCYACQQPLTADDQKSELFVTGKHCPHCFKLPSESNLERCQRRTAQVREECGPLPGSRPYDNHRPMNVPLRFDGLMVLQFLCQYHSHVDADYWQNEIAIGRILYKDNPVELELKVWAGQRLVHLIAGTVEPDVNADIELLYEDDDLLAVNKPAPLAMHPCGRFNRNSLSYILNAAYSGEKIRMTHRLDANTTGVVVFARKRAVAQAVQNQFEQARITKTYLARVSGIPVIEQFECNTRISREPGIGGVRTIDSEGHDALTTFKVVSRFADGTTLIECCPHTGRTNQIRLHLWSLGYPIVNDPSYLIANEIGTNQTLSVDDEPMCLHALRLKLEHPVTKEMLELESPRPTWCG